MAQMKYWRVRLGGRLSPDEVGERLPEGALNILRVDQEGDETQVYYAAADAPGAPRLASRAGEGAAEEVSLDVVTRIE